MLLSIIYIIIGFASLIFGANWLIDGASSLAKKLRVSDLAIGLTIVAFGTSAPELVVNSVASLNGLSDIVLGNVIGSNNFNLFIILGLSGIIYPIMVQSSTAWREIPISLSVCILLLILANDFFGEQPYELSRLDGIIMLLGFLAFIFYVFRQLKVDTSELRTPIESSNLKITVLIVLGLIGLLLGGKLVVDNAVKLAADMGASQKIIGLTILAAGTSLPELVTSIVAAIKKNSDIAIGNVLGSNIFNVLLILSISSIINPVEFNRTFNQEILILLGGTLLLLIFMLTGKRKKLDRWEAILLFGLYLIYIIVMVFKDF